MLGRVAAQVPVGPEFFLPGDAADEKLRIEVGTAGEGEDLTVSRVHRDDGPSPPRVSFLPHPLDGGVELILGDPLDVEVHGQLQVLAWHGLGDVVGQLLARIRVYGLAVLVHEAAHRVDPAPLGNYAPEGVHVVRPPARFAAQNLLVGELDPALADHGVGIQALERLLLELILGYGAGVPEDVGGEAAFGVATDPVVVDGDALELPGTLADVSHRIAARVLLDQDGTVLATGFPGRVIAAEYGLRVGPHDRRQLLYLVPGDLVGDDGHVQPGDVVSEDLAVAVVDYTALGGDLDVGVLGCPRGQGVVLARQNLQIPEPGAEDEEDGGDQDRQGDNAHLHVALGHRRRLHTLFRGVRLLLLSHRRPEQPLPYPLFLGSATCSHSLGLDDQSFRVIGQGARLQRDYVPARERSGHRNLVRTHDKDLEHLVDVAPSRRVGDEDPVPLLQDVQIPERQPAVRSREAEPVAGDVDVRLPVPGVAGPAEVHGGVVVERPFVAAFGVGHRVVVYLGHLRDRHPQHLALRPPAHVLLPGRRLRGGRFARCLSLPLDGPVDLPGGHREFGLLGGPFGRPFGGRADLLGGRGVLLRGGHEEAGGHHDTYPGNQQAECVDDRFGVARYLSLPTLPRVRRLDRNPLYPKSELLLPASGTDGKVFSGHHLLFIGRCRRGVDRYRVIAGRQSPSRSGPDGELYHAGSPAIGHTEPFLAFLRDDELVTAQQTAQDGVLRRPSDPSLEILVGGEVLDPQIDVDGFRPLLE